MLNSFAPESKITVDSVSRSCDSIYRTFEGDGMRVSRVQYLFCLQDRFEASDIDVGSIDHDATQDWDKALVEDTEGKMWLATVTHKGCWSGGVETALSFFPVGWNGYEGNSLKHFAR